MLLQRDTLETLPDQSVEIVVDLRLDPCQCDEDETRRDETLYSSRAKRGTTAFHAYATIHARVRDKRCTPAVRQLVEKQNSLSQSVRRLSTCRTQRFSGYRIGSSSLQGGRLTLDQPFPSC